MKNNLQLFNNKEFGEIRIVDINNKPYAVGNDIARALEYATPKDAISAHCKGAISYRLPTKGGKQEMKVIPEGDIYRLIVKAADQSRNPKIKEKAERFERWIFDEVLPTIRKAGIYSAFDENPNDIKRLEAEVRNRNSRVRESNQYLKIAKAYTNAPKYQEVLYAKAAEILAGKSLLPLPDAGEKTYSANEIALMFGVSAKRIGMIANSNNLKTPEYGRLFISKSEHSVKEVETWRYFKSSIPVFARIFGKEVSA